MTQRLQLLYARVRHFYDTYARWMWLMVIVAVAVVLLWRVWAYGWNWIGFWGWTGVVTFGPVKKGGYGRTYYPAKTLWDWLQLLVVPIALAVIGYILNRTQKTREEKMAKDNRAEDRRIAEENRAEDRKIAEENRQTDQTIAEDRQQEAALGTYLATMTTLLLDKGLAESKEDDETRAVARAQTLTVLGRLNGARKGAVMRFLKEGGLIGGVNTIISLHKADLSHADLSLTDLSLTNLNLTDLSGAVLYVAFLARAELRQAKLSKANLHYAHLSNADLSGADLTDADLSGAYLPGADLDAANLRGADLSESDLTGAHGTTDEQLKQAKSLAGATLPDGMKHP